MERYLSAVWLRSLSAAFVLSTLLPIHARGDVIVNFATISTAEASIRRTVPATPPLEGFESRNDNQGPTKAEVFLEQGVTATKTFASSLAETSGNMEVGVRLVPVELFVGPTEAIASTSLVLENTSDIFVRNIPIEFALQAGEVSVIGTQRDEDSFPLSANASITADIFFSKCLPPCQIQEDDRVLLFHYALAITGGTGSIVVLDKTDNVVATAFDDPDTGRSGFFTTFFEDVLELPELGPGEHGFVDYEMTAKGSAGAFEEGFTARFGDPFDAAGGGFLRRGDVATSVPEPGSLLLLSAGLIALARVSRRRRR